jgi:fe2+-dicitrate sensor, membrane component
MDRLLTVMKDEVLYRYFNNEATSEEVQQIEDWLKADSRHQQEFDAVHMLFNATILQRAHYERPVMHRIVSTWSMRRVGRISMHIAAAIALIVGAGYVGRMLEQDRVYQTMTSKMNVLEVPAGQRITVSLEDGTTVSLNGGSRMEYPLLFAKDQRHVKLSGEALFDVEHNPKQPFVVETFASEIEVLGTKFNVFADDKNNRFSTILVNGKIRATNLLDDGQEQVTLNPNEMVRLMDGHLVTSKISDLDALCWTDGYINIRNVAFDELMQRFEKAYDVKIVIDRQSLPLIGYASGKIRISEGIDFALHLLQQACDFSYTKDETNNTITIR